jgi:hypothetical protein
MTKPVNVDEGFFSKFDLGADYLRGTDMLVEGVFKSFTLTIDEFFPRGSQKSEDGKLIQNHVISFKEAKKRMILNKTNEEMLHLISGTSDGTKTPGIKVRIEARAVEAFGDTCVGIRLMPFEGMLLRKGLKKRLGSKVVWEGQKLKNEGERSSKETEPEPSAD